MTGEACLDLLEGKHEGGGALISVKLHDTAVSEKVRNAVDARLLPAQARLAKQGAYVCMRV